MMLLKQIGGQENINEKTPIIVVESGGSRFTIIELGPGKLRVVKVSIDDSYDNIIVKKSDLNGITVS